MTTRLRRAIFFPVSFAAVFVPAAAVFAAGPTPTPKPTPPPRRYVLVEAQGPAPEVRAFVPHFLSEVSDRDWAAISDAVAAGVRLADLKADPNGAVAVNFRKEWPADVYVGATLSSCNQKSRDATVPGFDDPMTGARTFKIIRSVQTECSATVTLVDATNGKALSSVSVTGINSVDSDSMGAGAEDPAEPAVRLAAEKAAKKLFPKKR